MNIRPVLCRERLREEGKPYLRSKCQGRHFPALLSAPDAKIKCQPYQTDARPAGPKREHWRSVRS